MALAGVNLRQEDIPQFLDACTKAGIEPKSIPVLYCLHDDTPELLQSALDAAQDLNVAVYRCMVSDSRLAPPRIPEGSHIIGWNEADDDSAYPNLPAWVDAWWQWVRSLNRNLVIHYGAPDVTGFLLENGPLEAALDIVDRHIGSTFSPPAPVIEGKPAWVTEVDIDPARFDFGDPASMAEAYAELNGCMQRCIEVGITVFAWGILQDRPDAAYSVSVLQAITALNAVKPQTQAERAFNTLTNNGSQVPGKQYVQDNHDGTFTTVVQFASELQAERGYNAVAGSRSFVPGSRYVQKDRNGSFTVVVRFPLV